MDHQRLLDAQARANARRAQLIAAGAYPPPSRQTMVCTCTPRQVQRRCVQGHRSTALYHTVYCPLALVPGQPAWYAGRVPCPTPGCWAAAREIRGRRESP